MCDMHALVKISMCGAREYLGGAWAKGKDVERGLWPY